ncbi:cytoplasmic protein [candidate division KSB1 bacterium 4484_87]|nr:MAG: cytoplasmic protein [candidate division KSB1 bacterium 4484_87]
MNRREFIKIAGISTAALSGVLPSLPLIGEPTRPNLPMDLAVVRNGQPAAMVRKAVEMLGGMSKFVKKGQTVVVKPNIGWDRVPEQAATTNPEVVAEVVRMCKEAGASKVMVFDNTCNQARRCYTRSQIQKKAKEAGADVSFMYKQKFQKVRIPDGIELKTWEIYTDALKADVLINVPIAKHHSLSRVTLGMKNLMGLIGGNRGKIHNHFNVKITDLNTIIKPQLTILDAVRILLRNGPQGGNLKDVNEMNTIVAGADIVAVDAFGATLFGLLPDQLGFLKEAYSRGLGEMNLDKLKIKKVSLS